jgi:bifunctional non-homologous end joining protein LigD
VPGDVLQRKSVRVLSRLRQKRVAQSVKSGIRRRRRARSKSEFRFISRCPRMAEILAGESRNTRERDGVHLDKSDPGSRRTEIGFIDIILLGSLKRLGDYIQSLAATFGHLNAVKDKIPFRVRPMLATLVGEPFHEPGWVYEEKYDGIRILAYKEGSQVTLLSRNDKNRTASFPPIARAIGALRPTTLLLDGEVIALDRHKVSRFQLLQRGIGRVRYAVFDCLCVNGRDLRHEPLSTRRAELERLVHASDELTPSRRLSANGLQAFRFAKRRGYEGLVAKRLASVYVAGRSREWLKVKVNQEDEFIILGYTEPSGSREHFGALLLGAYRYGELRYVGKVGTGFTRDVLASLYRKFQPLKRKQPSVDLPRLRATSLAPKLVAQISYTEWTKDGKLRHPVFLGLRDDKDPRDVALPQAK